MLSRHSSIVLDVRNECAGKSALWNTSSAAPGPMTVSGRAYLSSKEWYLPHRSSVSIAATTRGANEMSCVNLWFIVVHFPVN